MAFKLFSSFYTMLFFILLQFLAQSDDVTLRNWTENTTKVHHIFPEQSSEHDKVRNGANTSFEYRVKRRHFKKDDERRKRSFKEEWVKTCGNTDVWANVTVLGRSWPTTTSTQTKYASVLFLIDNEMYNLFKKDEALIEKRVNFLIEDANEAFGKVNIVLSLYDIVYWKDKDYINFDYNALLTIDNLVAYNSNNLRTGPNSDFTVVHLLTNRTFDGRVQGVAKTEAVCNHQYAVGFTTAAGRDKYEVAYTFKHELGHNVGMDHDNQLSCTCGKGNKNCIMKEIDTSYPLPVDWSDCSVQGVNFAEEKKALACMLTEPKRPQVNSQAESEGSSKSTQHSSLFIMATTIFVISTIATSAEVAFLYMKTRHVRKTPDNRLNFESVKHCQL